MDEVKCGQYLRDNLSNASECEYMADAIGKAKNVKCLKKRVDLVEYEGTMYSN